MKFLEGESVERFISKYTLLQTGHWAFQRVWRRAEGAARLVRLVLDKTVAQMRGCCCRFYQSGQLLFILLPHFVSPAECNVSSCCCWMDTRRMLKRVQPEGRPIEFTSIYWHFVQKTNVVAVVPTLKQFFMDCARVCHRWCMICTKTQPAKSHLTTLIQCLHTRSSILLKKQVKHQ